jgi:hypothetical protein
MPTLSFPPTRLHEAVAPRSDLLSMATMPPGPPPEPVEPVQTPPSGPTGPLPTPTPM